MTDAISARILVAEDNDTLRRGIVLALRESGGEVTEAASGERAIALLRDAARDPYDVVVTDLRLPGADGLAVLGAARERDPRTSVVLMTAYGTIETAVQAMRSGAFDFVQKPLDLDQFELRVGREAHDHLFAIRVEEPATSRSFLIFVRAPCCDLVQEIRSWIT